MILKKETPHGPFLTIFDYLHSYQWILYREAVDVCPDGEMEIGFILEFDGEHQQDNRVLIYKDRGLSTEQIIFDSDTDHNDGAVSLQQAMVVDLCVPDSSEYVFEVSDTAGDGFAIGGLASVFQNGQLLDSFAENFGSVASITIPALVSSTPSALPSSTPTGSPSVATSPPTGSPSVDTVSPTLFETESPVQDLSSRSPTPAPVTESPVQDFITRTPTSDIGGTIFDIVAETTSLDILTDALVASGLNRELSRGVSFLLLAPSDDAFAEFAMIHPDLASALLEPQWIEHLRELLSFHVSADSSPLERVSNGVTRLRMLSDGAVTVIVRGGMVTALSPTVDGSSASVLVRDIEASNGAIDVIESVLRPSFLSADLHILTRRYFPAFASLLVESGLDDLVMNSFGYTVRHNAPMCTFTENLVSGF